MRSSKTSDKLLLAALSALFALVGASCGVAHIKEYKPKRRKYEPVVAHPEQPKPSEDGSIWSSGAEGQTLFTDVRAFSVNDLVMVNIEEMASARRDTQTSVGREGRFKAGADAAGMIQKLLPGANTSELAFAEVGSGNETYGQTERNEDVRFTVAATVTKVLPNGNLFVEGHRVVLVNNEEHHFYISGVARREDILRNNTISSARLADAEVEFTGKGILTESDNPGWLTRLLNYISPF